MAKVRVRYRKGGRERVMPDYYARTLIKLNLVDVVEDEPQPTPEPSKPKKSYTTRQAKVEETTNVVEPETPPQPLEDASTEEESQEADT